MNGKIGSFPPLLTYRGYAIEELAENCEFEETAHLLIRGRLPSPGELKAYKTELANNRRLPPDLLASLCRLPKEAHPMDVQRTACSILGCLEPEAFLPDLKTDEEKLAQVRKTCERIMPVMLSSLCFWYHFANSRKQIAINTDPEDSLAESFLKMLLQTEKVNKLHAHAVDRAFTLYAEQGFEV